jgi:predicted site-specific integrase-resolvase
LWWSIGADLPVRLGNTFQAALAVQDRELVAVDSAEVDDDLVRYITEILTSMCARLYGKLATANHVRRAIDPAAGADVVAA